MTYDGPLDINQILNVIAQNPNIIDIDQEAQVRLGHTNTQPRGTWGGQAPYNLVDYLPRNLAQEIIRLGYYARGGGAMARQHPHRAAMAALGTYSAGKGAYGMVKPYVPGKFNMSMKEEYFTRYPSKKGRAGVYQGPSPGSYQVKTKNQGSPLGKYTTNQNRITLDKKLLDDFSKVNQAIKKKQLETIARNKNKASKKPTKQTKPKVDFVPYSVYRKKVYKRRKKRN